MKKKSNLITASLLTIVLVASNAFPQQQNAELYDWLAKYPARSALELEALNSRMLSLGEPGVRTLCSLLQAENPLATQAEFAIGGMVLAVTRTDAGSERKMLIRGLVSGLQSGLPVENKVFLLEQIDIVGNDDAVPTVADLINDSHLSDAAIRTLLAIGTDKAGKVLLKAYSKAENPIKLKLLAAFARVQNKNADRLLEQESSSENKAIAEAANASLDRRQASSAKATPLADDTLSMQELTTMLLAPGLETRLSAIDGLMTSGEPSAPRLLIGHLLRIEDTEEIDKTEFALLHVPVTAHLETLHGALSIPRPATRVAILRLLTARRAEQYAGDFLRIAFNDDSEPVRLAALKGLETLGTVDMLPAMVENLPKTVPAIQPALRQAYVTVSARESAQAQAVDLVLAHLEKGAAEQKDLFIPLLGKLAGPKALQKTVELARSTDPVVHDAAQRTLFEWPEATAIPHLLQIAEKSEALREHVLALRACARFMQNDSVSEAEKLSLFDRAMVVTRRPDEQKMFIGGLQHVRTPLALNRALHYLDQPELAFEAAVTFVELSGTDGEQQQPISRGDILETLLGDRLPPETRAQVYDYFDAQFEHNRPPAGFEALFNGADLTGWKGLVKNPPARAKMAAGELASEQAIADSIMQAHWSVENGVLKFDGTQYYHICTQKDYGDFELLIDWKIGKEGDSGLYLRGSPQVQIWDYERPDAGVGSGGLYNNQKHPSTPLTRADKPVGEWNTFRIIMIGEKVTVFLNDILVVDNVVLENYWQRDLPIYASGQIELQAHNTPLWFRNIFIREIPRTEPPFEGDLFNGSDLTGWQIINGQKDGWGVKDGILYTTGKGGGWLSTEREYNNFKLELEYRMSEGGNSGVFVRAPHMGDPAYTGMEIQVLDDYAEKYATLKPWQYTGSVYAVQASSPRVTWRAGEWQKMVIVCNGPKVDVTLNGTKIIDTNLIEHMDKLRKNPGLRRRSGYIGLQNHGSLVEYRNIQLTELRPASE